MFPSNVVQFLHPKVPWKEYDRYPLKFNDHKDVADKTGFPNLSARPRPTVYRIVFFSKNGSLLSNKLKSYIMNENLKKYRMNQFWLTPYYCVPPAIGILKTYQGYTAAHISPQKYAYYENSGLQKKQHVFVKYTCKDVC